MPSLLESCEAYNRDKHPIANLVAKSLLSLIYTLQGQRMEKTRKGFNISKSKIRQCINILQYDSVLTFCNFPQKLTLASIAKILTA